MSIATDCRTIVQIVDSHPADYAHLLPFEDEYGLEFRFVPDARAALRLPSEDRVWVINLQLPDFSGVDLYSMLCDSLHGLPVFLVSDVFSAVDEMRARRVGTAMYVCKPLQPNWFQQYSRGSLRSQRRAC